MFTTGDRMNASSHARKKISRMSEKADSRRAARSIRIRATTSVASGRMMSSQRR
jgi:hypothetical protein